MRIRRYRGLSDRVEVRLGARACLTTAIIGSPPSVRTCSVGLSQAEVAAILGRIGLLTALPGRQL
jgi:hypothetical protein